MTPDSVSTLLRDPEFQAAVKPWPELLVILDSFAKSEKVNNDSESLPIQDRRAFAKFISEVATSLWRLRKSLSPAPAAREDSSRSIRHLEAIVAAFDRAGFLIQDHTGEAFNYGLSLRVVAYQPTEGIERETVIETIKPSVYWRRHPLQMGEVIVGTQVATTDTEGK